jgi:hypothetical protein
MKLIITIDSSTIALALVLIQQRIVEMKEAEVLVTDAKTKMFFADAVANYEIHLATLRAAFQVAPPHNASSEVAESKLYIVEGK